MPFQKNEKQMIPIHSSQNLNKITVKLAKAHRANANLKNISFAVESITYSL